VTDHQYPESGAQSKEDEALFIARMVWVLDKPGVFIQKYRLRLFKGDAMFFLVMGIFSRISSKDNIGHNYKIIIS
jgi:hypothetical protein